MNMISKIYCFLIKIYWVIVLLSLFILINPAFANSSQAKPLTLAQIEQLIKAKSPDSLVANTIRKRGLAFKPYREVINKLEEMGAGSQTLKELRQLEPLLEEAKKDIPDILNKIYDALNNGNPKQVSRFLSSDILNDSRSLDDICQPFAYRAHYIENIIERPGYKFYVRVRVLFKPLKEHMYTLVFGTNNDSFYLKGFNNSDTDEWLKPFEDEAQELAKNFVYALKAGNEEVVNKSITPYLQAKVSLLYKFISENVEFPVSPQGIKLVNPSGIKVEVDIGSSSSLANYCIFLVDRINGENKIVGWEVHGWLGWNIVSKEEDPQIANYTLKRFGLSAETSGENTSQNESSTNTENTNSTKTENASTTSVKQDLKELSIYGMVYNYTTNKKGAYLVSKSNDTPQIFPKILHLGFDPIVVFDWDGSYKISNNKLCLYIKNVQIVDIQHKKLLNLSDYSNSQDIPSDYKDIGIGYHVKLKNATFENGKNEEDVYIYRTTQAVPDEIQDCVKIIPSK